MTLFKWPYSFKSIFTMPLLFILLTAGNAFANGSCQSLFSHNETPRLVQVQSWSEFATNPHQHNPEKFSYLVHDIFGFSVKDAQKTIWKNDQADSFNLIQNPERIAEVAIYSASLINENHVRTYGGGWGVILKVPTSNLIAATPVDMKSSNIREALPDGAKAIDKEAKLLRQQHGLPSPTEIMQQTPQGKHNEVLLWGTSPTHEKVEVVGFYIIRENGRSLIEMQDQFLKPNDGSEGQLDQILKSAQKHNLPLIFLDKK